MMNTHARYAAALTLLVALTATLPAAPLAAQDAEHTPTFLAIPQTFPDVEARAVLMLEPGRDIVLLHEDDAEPETLQIALDVLARMRRDHPRPAERGQLVPITGFVYRSPLAAERRAALQSTLDELQRRPLANVGNLGLGRWMPYRERSAGRP